MKSTGKPQGTHHLAVQTLLGMNLLVSYLITHKIDNAYRLGTVVYSKFMVHLQVIM